MKYVVARLVLLTLNVVLIGEYLGAPDWFAYVGGVVVTYLILPVRPEGE